MFKTNITISKNYRALVLKGYLMLHIPSDYNGTQMIENSMTSFLRIHRVRF